MVRYRSKTSITLLPSAKGANMPRASLPLGLIGLLFTSNSCHRDPSAAAAKVPIPVLVRAVQDAADIRGARDITDRNAAVARQRLSQISHGTTREEETFVAF